MNRFPLLEQMRADREKQEDEITAPVRAVLAQCQDRATRLASSLRALERVVGSEVGKRVVEQIGHEVGKLLRIEIIKALASVNSAKPEVFTLALPSDVLRFMDPRSIESEVLSRFAQEAAPQLSVRVDADIPKSVTVMDIHIPEMGYRRTMTDMH